MLYLYAHAHLDKYSPGLTDNAIEEIEENRILTVAVSMDIDSYPKILDIAGKSGLVMPAFGIHPWAAPEFENRLDECDPYINSAVMIGEIGLDFHWVKEVDSIESQYNVFEYFLKKASQTGKIVNLHTKGAEKEILRLLKAYEIEKAIIHWYSGPEDQLDELIDYGCWFTVGVEVMSSEIIQDITRKIPDDKILTETDNPGGYKYLTDWNGMPGLIGHVVRAAAACRKTKKEDFMKQVMNNFKELGKDDSRLSEWITRAAGNW